MKLLRLLLLCLPLCAIAIEPKPVDAIAPADLGLTKSIYTSADGKVLACKITISEDGVVKTEVESLQANAALNQITLLHGTPPWARGPIFHAGGLSFRFNGADIVAITGNNTDTFEFKLKARPEKDARVVIRVRELGYDEAKAEYADLPAKPVAGTDNTSWWKRYDKVKTEKPARPASPAAAPQAQE